MNLLNRLEKLEKEYVVKKVEAPKFIIKFVSPLNKNKALDRLSNGGVIYERMLEESENEFIKRILDLNADNLVFDCS